MIAGTGIRPGGATAYHEDSAVAADDTILPGWTLMGEFLKR